MTHSIRNLTSDSQLYLVPISFEMCIYCKQEMKSGSEWQEKPQEIDVEYPEWYVLGWLIREKRGLFNTSVIQHDANNQAYQLLLHHCIAFDFLKLLNAVVNEHLI